MRKVALLSVCAILVALMASFASSGRAAPGKSMHLVTGGLVRPDMPCDPDYCGNGGGCWKTVRVTFQIFSGGQSNPAAYGNGCWDANAPKRNPAEWLVCDTNWYTSGNWGGPNWVYNETSASHGDTDKDVINWCSDGLSGGYVDMAYNPNDYPYFKRVSSDYAPIYAYFAETYSYSLFDLWKNETWVGRPMIDISDSIDDDNGAFYRTYTTCNYIGDGTRMGIYSDTPVMWSDSEAKLQYVVAALDRCTMGQ